MSGPTVAQQPSETGSSCSPPVGIMMQRMSKALSSELNIQGNVTPSSLPDHVKWNGYDLDLSSCIRAVLWALRSPTLTMLNSAVDRTGAGSGMSWSNRSPQTLFETAHTAMIDAILADERDHKERRNGGPEASGRTNK